MSELEKHFDKFRKNTIGYNFEYNSVFGKQKIIYADWVASGRLYKPIENKIVKNFGPYISNTHTETNEVSTIITNSYKYAQEIIKKHVNANQNDVIISTGFGMTSAINKLQRILGIKLCGQKINNITSSEKPVVFVTHMEHHSNHTSWLTTIADVVLLEPTKDLLIDTEQLEQKLNEYKDRKIKIGAFTAASNVTGIETTYHKMAEIMHKHNGYCFVDFAMAAPYVKIDMHPSNKLQYLDAITFSPHKFLGGPGSAGILIFNKKLYTNNIPDKTGGGTVKWTNAWGEYEFIDDIELREDGGTPGFIQAIRTALAIKLKDSMGVENIKKREQEIIDIIFDGFNKIDGIEILAKNQKNRLGAISFYHKNIHYNLIVKLLSDKFGIQVRGGCACAGTYGHYLLNVNQQKSKEISTQINKGDLSEKPGWVRLSIHPTMTNNEVYFIINALKEISKNYKIWEKDYLYNKKNNEFEYSKKFNQKNYKKWFNL